MVYLDPNEEFGQGRCVNCGLLSLHRASGAFEELSMPIRMGWEPTTDAPRCLVYQRRLVEELNTWATTSGTTPNRGISEVIRSPQTCLRWFGYVEGLSPQQHLERYELMELEKLRQRQTEVMLEIAREQTTIAREHATTAGHHVTLTEKLAGLSEKSDLQSTDFNKQTFRFNLLFVGLGALTIILAGIQVAQIAISAGTQHVIVDTAATYTVVPPALIPTLVPQSTPDTVGSPTQ